jgi:carbamoyl-phosphate synthase large subunit
MSAVAKKLSDRHFGIGGDGVIFVCPSDVADGRMRMFNEDGSEGKMCGNGVRCVAKFLYDHQLACKKSLSVETLSGIKTIELTMDGKEVVGATVNMGQAKTAPADIPVLLPGDEIIDRLINIGGSDYRITCISMGNPHCVVFTNDVKNFPLSSVGPLFEHSELFPESVNTEFVRVIDETHLEMRVWERGSGETLACGTGACASVAAAVKNGYCKKDVPVTVSLLGGDLRIIYSDHCVMMEGPAKTVFEGVCDLDKV